jgi:hypothetical protein
VASVSPALTISFQTMEGETMCEKSIHARIMASMEEERELLDGSLASTAESCLPHEWWRRRAESWRCQIERAVLRGEKIDYLLEGHAFAWQKYREHACSEKESIE